MSESTEHCCSVIFLVVGEALDPDEITALLGMVPDRQWRQGERKSFVRVDGSIQHFDSTYSNGGWKRFIEESYRSRPLWEQLHHYIESLVRVRSTLHEFAARGLTMTLDCFVASSETIHLSVEVLRTLADLQVEIEFWFSPD